MTKPPSQNPDEAARNMHDLFLELAPGMWADQVPTPVFCELESLWPAQWAAKVADLAPAEGEHIEDGGTALLLCSAGYLRVTWNRETAARSAPHLESSLNRWPSDLRLATTTALGDKPNNNLQPGSITLTADERTVLALPSETRRNARRQYLQTLTVMFAERAIT